MYTNYHMQVSSELERLRSCEERRLLLASQFTDMKIRQEKRPRQSSSLGSSELSDFRNQLLDNVDRVLKNLEDLHSASRVAHTQLLDRRQRFEEHVAAVFPDLVPLERRPKIPKQSSASMPSKSSTVREKLNGSHGLSILENVDLDVTNASTDHDLHIPRLELSNLHSTNNSTSKQWNNSALLGTTKTESSMPTSTVVSSLNVTRFSDDYPSDGSSMETVLKAGLQTATLRDENPGDAHGRSLRPSTESLEKNVSLSNRSDVSASEDSSIGPEPGLSIQGVMNILSCIEKDIMSSKQNITSYYTDAPPSFQQRQIVLQDASKSSELTVSLSTASVVLLEDLPSLCHSFTGHCVISHALLHKLDQLALDDPILIEEHMTKLVSDDAKTLWNRLLRHMKLLASKGVLSSNIIAQLFAPVLIHHKTNDGTSEQQFVAYLSNILSHTIATRKYSTSDDEESTTIASLNEYSKPQKNQKAHNGVGLNASLAATAGSFHDVDSSESEKVEIRAKISSNEDVLHKTADMELRAYAATLEDSDTDESSFNELTLDKPNLVQTHNKEILSNGSSLRESQAYKNLLAGSSITRQVSSDDDDNVELLVKSSEVSKSQTQGGLKSTHEILRSVSRDSDLDTDSDIENSFRGKLSLQTPVIAKKGSASSLRETEDDDFNDFYDN